MFTVVSWSDTRSVDVGPTDPVTGVAPRDTGKIVEIEVFLCFEQTQ